MKNSLKLLSFAVVGLGMGWLVAADEAAAAPVTRPPTGRAPVATVCST
jgi:hypothetical protein